MAYFFGLSGGGCEHCIYGTYCPVPALGKWGRQRKAYRCHEAQGWYSFGSKVEKFGFEGSAWVRNILTQALV